MNSARNEMIVKLAGEEILLRPTFENIAAMEANVGGVSYLGWKYSRGIRTNASGEVDTTSLVSDMAIKSLPSMSEVAQIIYYNQAASKPDDPTQRKYSLEEIWDKMLKNGAGGITRTITIYLARLTAGDRLSVVDDLTDAEKKSSVTDPNQAVTTT